MTTGSVHRAALALVLCAIGSGAALAGHTLGHYPSYYPDEIRIDLVGPYRRDRDVIQHVTGTDRLDHKNEPAGRALMERITVDEVVAAAAQRL